MLFDWSEVKLRNLYGLKANKLIQTVESKENKEIFLVEIRRRGTVVWGNLRVGPWKYVQ